MLHQSDAYQWRLWFANCLNIFTRLSSFSVVSCEQTNDTDFMGILYSIVPFVLGRVLCL